MTSSTTPSTARPQNAPLRPEQTAAGWDAVASDYARYLGDVTDGYAAEALRLAPVDGSMTVLDVAAGSGALALQAAPRAKSVLATDLSPRLVEILRHRAQEQGARNVTAEVMDGQALALGDNAFDRAYSLLGLMLFPDRARGFSELRRVLRPGGVAVVSSWNAPPHNEWMSTLRAAAARAFPQAPPPPAPAFLELADPGRLKKEMESAGFADVRVETIARTIEWPDADAYWGALVKATPWFRTTLEAMGEAAAAKLRAAVGDQLAEQARERGGMRHRAEAHYAVGVKR